MTIQLATLSLADAKTWVDIVGGIVTVLAVIIGGLWAYFNFVKGRTYRPHLEVALSGQWRHVDKHEYLQTRISVKNIGKSVVSLNQKGTGLRVSVLGTQTLAQAPKECIWSALRVFPVLADHDWIEPGETVSDDLLLDLALSAPQICLLEARLIWNWKSNESNIELTARKVLPVNSSIAGVEGGNENEMADKKEGDFLESLMKWLKSGKQPEKGAVNGN